MVESFADLCSLENLYLAYRKAKVDVFFERSQPMADAFCEYELSLHNNLTNLSKRLSTKKPNWYNDDSFIGRFGFIPKLLKLPKLNISVTTPHFSISDPEDAWKLLIKQCKGKKPEAVFRPVALFTVDMYIICALWVNHIGHKYDACLKPTARGSRLRRIRSKHRSLRAPAYHEEAPGSFQPYFYCYKQWRENGLKAIRSELSERRKVIAITMDLTSFYHSIDPRFILSEVYLKKVQYSKYNSKAPSNIEHTFTDQIITAFETWSKTLPNSNATGPAGVPVGPSAPRVIANVLLAEFDQLVERQLAPIYYGRYVDDIFLVLRDTGAFNTPDAVIKFIAKRIAGLKYSEEYKGLVFSPSYIGKSRLLFKSEKQRIFLLSGEIGEDLLDAIENKIDEVSSEWRLLPNLDDLDKSPAARVLTAAKASYEDADSLRKADELSLRRLGFSLMLRSVDAISRDLPPQEWTNERMRFYRFAFRHVITPLRLLDLNDYLPRLLGLAVACRDWNEAQIIVSRIRAVIKRLQRNVVVEPRSDKSQWNGYLFHLKQSLMESLISACHPSPESPVKGTVDRVIEEISKLSDEGTTIDPNNCNTRACEYYMSDLSRYPFKESLLDSKILPVVNRVFDIDDLPRKRRNKAKTINKFLNEINVKLPCILPLLFPTRPLSAPEITECVPRAVSELDILRDYLQALRGTWVNMDIKGDSHAKNDDIIEIGITKSR